MTQGKYKKSLNKIYGYCRWNHQYPPDDWCIFGISKWWSGPEYYRYNICFLGFELRIGINRIFTTNKTSKQ